LMSEPIACMKCGQIFPDGEKHTCRAETEPHPKAGEHWQPRLATANNTCVHVLRVDATSVLYHEADAGGPVARRDIANFMRLYEPLVTIGSAWRGSAGSGIVESVPHGIRLTIFHDGKRVGEDNYNSLVGFLATCTQV